MSAVLSPLPPLAASGTEQALLAFLFVIGALLNAIFKKGGLLSTWRARRTTATRVAGEHRPVAVGPPRNAEEERVRKLLEALGQAPGQRPATTTLPPFPGTNRPAPVQLPPPDPAPPRPLFLPTPPPVPVPPPNPPLIQPPPPRRPRRPESARGPATSANRPAPRATTPARELRTLLRGTRGQLRQAILLQEVLGPPRSLSERSSPLK